MMIERRGQPKQRLQHTMDAGRLVEILPAHHVVRAAGRTLPLSLQELSVLVELARRADRIVQREKLFRLAWGREMRPGDRSVDDTIAC